MKTLQEEAEDYCKDHLIKLESLDAFIAGATSKYVEHEKIKAQIEALEEMVDIIPDSLEQDIIESRIYKLKKQLEP